MLLPTSTRLLLLRRGAAASSSSPFLSLKPSLSSFFITTTEPSASTSLLIKRTHYNAYGNTRKKAPPSVKKPARPTKTRLVIPIDPSSRAALEASSSTSSFLKVPTQELGLHNLYRNPGSHKRAKQLGRGPGSKKGKTCGRGHKGRKARKKVPLHYEGGQNPLFNKLPIGIRNFPETFYDSVALDKIQRWIDTGRIDPSKPITMKELHDSGCCKVDMDGSGVRIHSRGADHFRTPVKIEVARISAAAVEAIERAGGQVVTRYYSKPAMNALLNPHLLVTPMQILEPERHLREYYKTKAYRGHLYLKNADAEEAAKYFPVEFRNTHIQPLQRPELANAFNPAKALGSFFNPTKQQVKSADD